MVKFTEQVQAVAESTLGALKGPKGQIGFNPTNLAGKARVIVMVKQANGDTYQCLCSPAVSEMLRSQEISVANLLTFPVRETTTESGETINSIIRPGSEIEWKDAKPAAYQPQVSIDELLKFV